MSAVRPLRPAWRSPEAIAFYLFASPAIAYLLLLAIGPMIASFILSFTYWDMLTPPVWVGLENYHEMLFEDPLFWKSLQNTLYFTLFTVPAGTILPFLVAVALNQGVRLQGFYRTAFYIPSILPVVASSMLWLWLLNPEQGIVNMLLAKILPKESLPLWMYAPEWSKPAIILTTIWGAAGGPPMLIYLAGLQTIPQSLKEAAAIDGASRFQRFLHITIPMMSPYFLFTTVMGFIGGFQVFTQALVMTQRGDGAPVNSTLFYVLYLYRKGFREFDLGYASAMAWFLFAIILIVTWLQFRFSRDRVHYA